ncbi:MAG: hypothetical protein ACI8UO_004132 [Verrucomicrobiales bacterium]|jgi:hypothetical protein
MKLHSHPILLFSLLLSSVSQAQIEAADIDVSNSAIFREAKSEPAAAETIAGLIAPAANEFERVSWTFTTSQAEQRSRSTWHFRIAFKDTRSLGGMTAAVQNAEEVSVRVLKADAPFPGDPAVADQWTEFPATQAAETVDCVFPPNFETRAILISDARRSGQANLRGLRFHSERRHRITGSAIAQGEQTEYGDDASNLLVGKTWRNAGMEPNSDEVARSLVTKQFPSWANLVWNEPQTVSMVRIRSSAETFELREFIGEPGQNPALAPAAAWRVVNVEPVKLPLWRSRHLQEVTYHFETPKSVRALQFHVTKVDSDSRNSSILEIQDFGVFRDLGDGEAAPAAQQLLRSSPLPPAQFPWATDIDSEPAMVVNTPDGRRVRNLFAQVPTPAGEHVASWDLKDSAGVPVAPGVYHWEAIYGPEPRLIYQMTPYPNTWAHSAHSSPWQGDDTDGWLSNHGRVQAVCAVGDHVFIGQNGSEGGHALIEVTNSGSKIWGSSATADTLFTDGETLFNHGKWRKNVSRFDPETKKLEPIFGTEENPARKGEVVGLAARKGKIYVAFHAPVPYLEVATGENRVAIEHCLPKLREEINGDQNQGIEGRPQWDFMSHFRLTDWVNGSDGNGGLLWIPSTKGKGRAQHILLAFTEPTPLGSLVFPPYVAPEGVAMKAYVLKAEATFPPKLDAADDWTEIPLGEVGPWNCVALPEQTKTRALRLTFAKPGGELDALLDGVALGDSPPEPDLGFPGSGKKKGAPGLSVGGSADWQAHLDGMRILRRRFADVSATATIRVSSGEYVAETGEWDAQRETVLDETQPATLVMEWDDPQNLRGLSLKEVDGEEARIDVFTGPADAEINLAGDENWREVAVYNQERRFLYFPDRRNNADAIYIDGVADFGANYETRAVRIRVVSQWKEQTGRQWGIRRDRGGSEVDLKRCRIYGIAALRHLGGEPEKSAIGVQRIEVRDATSGQLLEDRPSSVTAEIAFSPDGQLHGIVGDAVVRLDDGAVVVGGLVNPRCLQISSAGEFFVYDHGEQNRQVKVFDSAGKFQRTIGKAGRRVAGPWDPEFLEDINEMTIDSDGNLWLVYEHDNPRRIIKFSAAGEFLAEFYGNTNYGGGGIVDPWDPTRMYYRDMVFKLDPDTGESRLVALMSADHDDSSDQSKRRIRWLTEPIVLNDQRYIVTAPFYVNPNQEVGVIHLFDEESMTVRMCAAVGRASSFPPLQRPDMIAKTGGNPLGGYRFVWNDLSQDGEVDVDEVEFTKLDEERLTVGRFDEGLGIMSGNLRWAPERFLDDGTPILAEQLLDFSADFKLANGNYFRYAQEANEVVDPEGKLIWSYPAKQGMSGLFVPPYQPGVADVQYGIKGHGSATAGDLGDFVVTFANNGQANVWTADGLLAARLTRHQNDPTRKTFWKMDHARGTDVTGITWGQEHFFNYFSQSVADGRHFMVGGHLSVSLFEVLGLNEFKRVRGTIEVTPELLVETSVWDANRIETEQFAAPAIATSFEATVTIDGENPPAEYRATALEIEDLAELMIAHDDENLYLFWRAQGAAGPLKNTGTEFQRAFKTGGGVDIKLGLDPAAAADRRQPVAGDVRVILTQFNDKPTAVLYRPVAAAKTAPWETTTAAGGTTSFDEVMILRGVEMKVEESTNGYRLEAAVPWKALGLTKAPTGRLRFDWSVLSTETGNQTIGRRSWANELAVGVTDEPTEARLNPGLWGWLELQSLDGAAGAPSLDGALDKKKGTADLDSLIDGL